jgi:transcriptional regulator with XRE-family HTH domain
MPRKLKPQAGYRRALPALKERRLELGLSVVDVASQVPMPNETLYRVEGGRLRASQERQEALARRYTCTVDDLFAPPEPLPTADRDAAIVASYRRLGSAAKAAAKHEINKSTVLRAVKRAGATRDRAREKQERLWAVAVMENYGVPRTKMPEVLADKLTISASQSLLYHDLHELFDLHELGFVERRPRKHDKPGPRQCLNRDDPDCPHHEHEGWFTPQDASQVERGDGWTCSKLCARRSPASRERARDTAQRRHLRGHDELARRNAAGERNLRQVARRRKIGESTLARYISEGLIKAGPVEIIEGEIYRFISDVEYDRFCREEWPTLVRTKRLRRDLRQKWGRFRGGYTEPKAGGRRGRPRKYDGKERELKAAADEILRKHPQWGVRPVVDKLRADGFDVKRWKIEPLVAAHKRCLKNLP